MAAMISNMATSTATDNTISKATVMATTGSNSCVATSLATNNISRSFTTNSGCHRQ